MCNELNTESARLGNMAQYRNRLLHWSLVVLLTATVRLGPLAVLELWSCVALPHFASLPHAGFHIPRFVSMLPTLPRFQELRRPSPLAVSLSGCEHEQAMSLVSALVKKFLALEKCFGCNAREGIMRKGFECTPPVSRLLKFVRDAMEHCKFGFIGLTCNTVFNL